MARLEDEEWDGVIEPIVQSRQCAWTWSHPAHDWEASNDLVHCDGNQEEDEERFIPPRPMRIYVDDDGCISEPIGQWPDGSDRLPNHHNCWWLVYDSQAILGDPS